MEFFENLKIKKDMKQLENLKNDNFKEIENIPSYKIENKQITKRKFAISDKFPFYIIIYLSFILSSDNLTPNSLSFFLVSSELTKAIVAIPSFSASSNKFGLSSM